MFDEAIWASMNSWLTPTYLFLFLNLMIGTIFITSSFNSPKSQQQQQQQPSSQITRAPSSVIQRLKSVNIYSYQFSDPKPEFELERIPTPVEDQVQTQTQTRTRTWAVEGKQPLQITRAPSVLQRLKSINFHCYPFSEPKPGLEPKKLPAKVSQVSAQVQTRIQTKTKNRATRAPAIVEDVVDDDEGPTLDEIYSRIKGIAPTHNRHNSDTVPVNGDIPVKLPAKIKKSASHKSAFNHFHEANGAAATVKEEDIATVGAAIAATSGGGGAEVDARADDFINRFKKQLHLQRIESIVRYKD